MTPVQQLIAAIVKAEVYDIESIMKFVANQQLPITEEQVHREFSDAINTLCKKRGVGTFLLMLDSGIGKTPPHYKLLKADDCLITIECCKCKKRTQIRVKTKDLMNWVRGASVQKSLAYLNANERELLCSRTCGTCFDELFPKEEEDGGNPLL